MPNPPEENELTKKRYATLILRLLLDRRGRLLHSELVDVAAGLPIQFVRWRGLLGTVRVWLSRQAQAGAPEEL